MLPPLDLFLPLALTAALAGLVRGFTGFGSALVFTPIASAIVEPWQAIILLFVMDGITALPLLPDAVRHCTWREVVPLSLGATVAVPVGAHFLLVIDPTALRWLLSALSLGAVAALASGWRYHALPGPAMSAVVGASSGFLGGMCSFWGPPIVLFWLGGQSGARTVRANVIVFLLAMTVVGAVTYAAYGLFKPAVVSQAFLLIPFFGIALWLGTRLYKYASEELFRRISYLVIAGAAVGSAPAFDRSA
jgi:uncharacterized membrane protein YfcA